MTYSVRILPSGTIVRESGRSQFFNKNKLIPFEDNLELDNHDMTERSNSSNLDFPTKFPRFRECAHFHYETVNISNIELSLPGQRFYHETSNTCWFYVLVVCGDNGWTIKRSFESICKTDKLLHQCVYNRNSSGLPELKQSFIDDFGHEKCYKMLSNYIETLSGLLSENADVILCGPILAWMEIDCKGKHASYNEPESSVNIPAIGAAHAIKSYVAQASDEISFEVGDIISVIDVPPSHESSWWQGKKDFKVGYFPSECVELFTGGSNKQQNQQDLDESWEIIKPVLKKREKFVAFLLSFFSSRPNKIQLKRAGIVQERLFGCDLGEHLSKSNRDVPVIETNCIKFIEDKGVVDGIYRLSGAASNVQRLRNQFDADEVPDLYSCAILQDFHCVSSILKMYFRELPNPLLTHQLYDRLMEVEEKHDLETKLRSLTCLINLLPPPHYRTAKVLFLHLQFMVSKQLETSMNAKNLSIVWAPNILCPIQEEVCANLLILMNKRASLVECIINNAHILFKELECNQDILKPSRPPSCMVSPKLISLEEARKIFGGGVTVPEMNMEIKHVHAIINVPKGVLKKKIFGSTKMKGFQSYQDLPILGNYNLSGKIENCEPASGSENQTKLKEFPHTRRIHMSFDETLDNSGNNVVNLKPLSNSDPNIVETNDTETESNITGSTTKQLVSMLDGRKKEIKKAQSFKQPSWNVNLPSQADIQLAKRNLNSRMKKKIVVEVEESLFEYELKKKEVGVLKKMEEFLQGQVIEEDDECLSIDKSADYVNLTTFKDTLNPALSTNLTHNETHNHEGGASSAYLIMNKLINWQESKMKLMNKHPNKNYQPLPNTDVDGINDHKKPSESVSLGQSERTVNKLRSSFMKGASIYNINSDMNKAERNIPNIELTAYQNQAVETNNRRSENVEINRHHSRNLYNPQHTNKNNNSVGFDLPPDRESSSYADVIYTNDMNQPTFEDDMSSGYDNALSLNPSRIPQMAYHEASRSANISASCGDLCGLYYNYLDAENNNGRYFPPYSNKSNSHESVSSKQDKNYDNNGIFNTQRTGINSQYPYDSGQYFNASHYNAHPVNPQDYRLNDYQNVYSSNYVPNITYMKDVHSTSHYNSQPTIAFQSYPPPTYPSNVPYSVHPTLKYVTFIDLNSPDICPGTPAPGATVITL